MIPDKPDVSGVELESRR